MPQELVRHSVVLGYLRFVIRSLNNVHVCNWMQYMIVRTFYVDIINNRKSDSCNSCLEHKHTSLTLALTL